MRTLTNLGTPAAFRIQHLDCDGGVVETRLIFSTNAPKAHRKLREVLGWEDDVFDGDVFTLESSQGSTWAEIERFEILSGGDEIESEIVHASAA